MAVIDVHTHMLNDEWLSRILEISNHPFINWTEMLVVMDFGV